MNDNTAYFFDSFIASICDLLESGDVNVHTTIDQYGFHMNVYPCFEPEEDTDDDEPDCENCTDTDCIYHPDFDPCCCDDAEDEDENAKDDGIEVVVHKIESTEEAIEKLKEIFEIS